MGARNRRRRTGRMDVIRRVPYNNGRGGRRDILPALKIFAMLAVTAVLLFFSIRSLVQLIRGEKTPDVTAAVGMNTGDAGKDGLNLADKGIVMLSENVRDSFPQETSEPDKTLEGDEKKGVLVVVDPGHGGYDNGSNIDGIYEQVITLEVSLCLVDKLQELGYETLILREDNETHLFPEERVEMAEDAKADVFVSIHLNTYDGSEKVSGMETWYYDKNPGGEELAGMVQKAASRATGARDRGLKMSKELIVTRDTTMPSCLVEVGFLTDKTEREALMTKEYQEKVAEGIAQGIDDFIRSRNEEHPEGGGTDS